MKKLFYFSTFVLPSGRAHGVQVVKMCSEFSKLFETTLFVKRIRGDKSDIFTRYGVEDTFNIVVPELRVGESRLAYIKYAHYFGQLMRKNQDSVFYTRDHRVGFFLTLLGCRNFFYEMHSWPTGMVKHFVRFLCNRCNGVISTNTAKRDRMVSDWGIDSKRIIVARNGVSVKEFMLQGVTKEEARKRLKLPEGYLAGYLGRFEDRGIPKGVDVVIKAASHNLPDGVGFCLVGASPKEEERYGAMVEAQKASAPIHIRKAILHSEMPLYLRAMDYLILLYGKDEHAARFGSGIKTFEYMASGVPIVASRVPSVEEVLRDDTSFFFESGSADDLARALRKAHADPAEATSRANKALDEVAHYDWSQRARSIASFIVPK